MSTFTIPEPNEIVGALGPLPENRRAEWREAYAKAFEQSMVDAPGDESTARQSAQRDANRLFRVGKPATYKAARALGDWQLISRKEASGKFSGVTIDGARFSFDVPAEPAADESEKSKSAGASKK
jgi:hypothetical protein